MAQAVAAVPNPNYNVSPLTTVAGTIVNRRRVKVPVNFQGTYGPKNSGLNNIATFDIADNESFVDLSKLVLCMDITPTWHNPVAAPYDDQFETYLPPCFDQSSEALFYRVTIGTSQGSRIEEIINYGTWANIINMHTESAAHKEMSLMNYSDYSKRWGKDRGGISFIDGTLQYPAQGCIKDGVTKRLEIRFLQSSFLSRVRFLPLFLFRNGLRFEIEFEDVHRSFCYQISPAWNDMYKIPQWTSSKVGAALAGQTPQWLIANGNLAPDGTAVTIATPTGDTFAYPWPVAHRILPAPTTIAAGGAGVAPTASPVAGCLHQLFIGLESAQAILNDMGPVTPSVLNDLLPASEAKFFCYPVYIFEKGQLMYKAFIALNKLDLPRPATVPNLSAFRTLTNINNPNSATAQFAIGAGSVFQRSPAFTVYEHQGAGPDTANMFYYTTAGTPVNPPNLGTLAASTAAASGQCRSIMVSFPLYFYSKGGMTNPYYYKDVVTSADTAASKTKFRAYVEASKTLDATLFIDIQNRFVIPDYQTLTQGYSQSVTSPSYQDQVIDPYFVEETWPGIGGTNNKLIQWNYTLTNLEMLLDLVKPSSEDFLKFQKAYESPSGIPYAFKRAIYKQFTQTQATNGLLQIPLSLSVRSLSGLVVVMQDSIASNPGVQTDKDFTKYTYPFLSSFCRRGLNRAEVIVGGQTYPIYQMIMKPLGKTGATGDWSMSHILESENFFGVPGATSFNPSFNSAGLNMSRNYLLAGPCGITDSILTRYLSSNSSLSGAVNTPNLLDASSFVLAMSIQKDDVINFATGIDSSQSGQVTLNLYFNASENADRDPQAWAQRPIVFHMWALCDAVFTLQNDASVTRT